MEKYTVTKDNVVTEESIETEGRELPLSYIREKTL